ncbi:TIGR03757 family integrating conjugative element protein [Pseudomonas aeruginosa]|uniref:TIGR03757 family integrating conjugative element protein n=1 Tax=Pseudomonas aeruginosa TaxID=287 RepID=UPI00071B37B7|nr:TIGR03757 family integrating conjugative element protein [Pseudomonas aeruginosa]KSQ24964.1 integrating conjugative element protein [Pseudomonas aeruginosa]MCO1686929.1 TIGR03757 family integrating conjugative element protein [Pseudomonas aeruginosa]MCO1780344.1 TIGR03757 family integrating conjugative element protein [Pseudomonas aeruginosa]MCO1790170.1 TIGR03757 family integrating conjugative element protein [Pseudomonas aeruginosa]MCO1799190.1 TIGR03757 family integrating conjugative ele
MPTPPTYLRSARQSALATGLCAALLGPLALADNILVVTDSRHPIQAPAGVRVIELDLPARIKTELAADLSSDAQRSAALVQRRLRDGGVALQQRIGSAYQGVVDAWSLGITTIPAVVVASDEKHFVVYGEPDVTAAVALIEAHRRAQP